MIKEQLQKQNTKNSSNKTNLFKDCPTPPKSKIDWGKVTINALKRAKYDEWADEEKTAK